MKKKASRPRTLARQALRAIELHNPCVLLIKKGTDFAKEYNVKALVGNLSNMDIAGVVAIVDDFGDLTILSESDMNKLGWFFAPDKAIKDESEEE